jgi:hypothetical protein
VTVPGGIAAGLTTALAANPQVDFVEPDRVRKAVISPPNDTHYSSQWGLATVQALSAWNLRRDRADRGGGPRYRRRLYPSRFQEHRRQLDQLRLGRAVALERQPGRG